MGRAGRLGVLLGTGALLAAGLAATTTPASADADTTIAYWQMNESGGDVMHDSSANGIDGSIGDRVKVGGGIYSFAYVSPTAGIAYPGQLVTVDDPRLNPGTSDFSIEVRYRNTYQFGNLIQKGQNTTLGGYFKIELPAGKISCLFIDGTGARAGATLIRPAPAEGKDLGYRDGAWYTIRCERLASSSNPALRGIKLSVFDAGGALLQSVFYNKPTGNISNSKLLTIGGKKSCAQDTTTPGVTCDYFPGQVDWIRLSTGGKVVTPPATGTVMPLQGVRDPGGDVIHVTAPDDDSIRSYDVTARGTARLDRTMAGTATGLTGPWGAAADGHGNLWVAAETGDRISRFAASSTGSPSSTIRGNGTALSWPQGLTLDGAGRLYTANELADSVTVYAADADGNAAPVRSLKGAKTGLNGPVGVAVDDAGLTYVSNWDAGTVTAYGAGATGNAAPLRTISGLDHPYSLALDGSGALYVATDGAIKVFGSGASGKATPTRTIAVPDSSGVLVDPGRGLSVFSVSGEQLGFTDLRPVPPPPPPPPSPTITRPSAVSGLTVTGTATDKKRKVKWAVPAATGGAAITMYKVVVKHGKSKIVKTTVAASTTKLKLKRKNLPAGKSKVLVKAANKAGWGPKAKVTFTVKK